MQEPIRSTDSDIRVVNVPFRSVSYLDMLKNTDLSIVLPSAWLLRTDDIDCALEDSTANARGRRYMIEGPHHAGNVTVAGSPATGQQTNRGSELLRPASGLEVTWTPPKPTAWATLAPETARTATSVLVVAFEANTEQFRALLDSLQIVAIS